MNTFGVFETLAAPGRHVEEQVKLFTAEAQVQELRSVYKRLSINPDVDITEDNAEAAFWHHFGIDGFDQQTAGRFAAFTNEIRLGSSRPNGESLFYEPYNAGSVPVLFVARSANTAGDSDQLEETSLSLVPSADILFLSSRESQVGTDRVVAYLGLIAQTASTSGSMLESNCKPLDVNVAESLTLASSIINESDNVARIDRLKGGKRIVGWRAIHSTFADWRYPDSDVVHPPSPETGIDFLVRLSENLVLDEEAKRRIEGIQNNIPGVNFQPLTP